MLNKIEKVNVIGLGYVGQTLAVTLAEAGFMVYGSDINEVVLDGLRGGRSSVREPGIDDLIAKHLNKNLFIEVQAHIYSHNIDAFIISVSSPVNKQTKEPMLDSVKAIAEDIKKHIKPGQMVILRSTVPIGTTRNLVRPILEESGLRAGEDFGLAFAPERTIEGDALRELRVLPQIIGGFSEESVARATEMFRRTTNKIVPVSSVEAAEAVKLLDNSYRDVRFAYANEIANYFEKAGLNAFEVIKASGKDYPRNSIPLPSPGVGGACLSKDPYIFIKSAEAVSAKLEIIAKAREVNESMPRLVVERLKKDIRLTGTNVFIAGFAFKGQPETNDIRESPTLDLVAYLKKEGVKLTGFDPCVEAWKIRELGVECVSTLEGGFASADVIIFMINHPSFIGLRFSGFKGLIKPGTIIYDGWGMFNRSEIEAIGLKYKGVGIG